MSTTLQFLHNPIVSQYWLLDSVLYKSARGTHCSEILKFSPADISTAQEFHLARKEFGRKKAHGLVTRLHNLDGAPAALRAPWRKLSPKLEAFINTQEKSILAFSEALRQRWNQIILPWNKITAVFHPAIPRESYTIFIAANADQKTGIGKHIELEPTKIVLQPKLIEKHDVQSLDANIAIIIHEILHSLELQLRSSLLERFNAELGKNGLQPVNDESLLFGLCVESLLCCMAPHGVLAQEMGIATKPDTHQKLRDTPLPMPFNNQNFNMWRKKLTAHILDDFKKIWAKQEPILTTNLVENIVTWCVNNDIAKND